MYSTFIRVRLNGCMLAFTRVHAYWLRACMPMRACESVCVHVICMCICTHAHVNIMYRSLDTEGADVRLHLLIFARLQTGEVYNLNIFNMSQCVCMCFRAHVCGNSYYTAHIHAFIYALVACLSPLTPFGDKKRRDSSDTSLSQSLSCKRQIVKIGRSAGQPTTHIDRYFP